MLLLKTCEDVMQLAVDFLPPFMLVCMKEKTNRILVIKRLGDK